MTKVKQLKALAEQTFAVAHKLTYSYEIKDEEEASNLIDKVLDELSSIIQKNTQVSEPQEDLNLIKFDEDHTRDMLDTYAQIVKKKRQEVKTQIDIARLQIHVLKIEQTLPNFLLIRDEVQFVEELKRDVKKYQKRIVTLQERAQYIEKKNSETLQELQIKLKAILEQTKPDSSQGKSSQQKDSPEPFFEERKTSEPNIMSDSTAQDDQVSEQTNSNKSKKKKNKRKKDPSQTVSNPAQPIPEQLPAWCGVNSQPEKRDPNQFAYEFSFPPINDFENPLVGLSCNDSNASFNFIFKDGQRTKCPCIYPTVDRFIKPGGVVHLVRCWQNKASLWGLEFFDKNGKTLLKGGQCKPQPNVEHMDVFLKEGERICGIKSKVPQQSADKAHQVHFTFVISSYG